MPLALAFSAVVLGFVAASGFLLGQLFFGMFSVSATLAGCGGLVAAVGAAGMAVGAAWAPRWAFWPAAGALLGVVLDVAQYHLYAAIPGNYYGWMMIGPFAASAAFVAWVARRRLAQPLP
jgi:hypothetical protein